MITNDRVTRVIRASLSMQRWPWEQGIVAQAFMELGETELAVLMAGEAVVNQLADGRLAMKYERRSALDPASNGEPVLFAARTTGETRFAQAADKMLDYLLHRAERSQAGVLYHNENERKIWVDAYAMAPPFLAAAGHPDEALRQIRGFRNALWSDEKRLFYHQWDDVTKSFSRKLFWGVGNGWAAVGMTRVMRLLPREMVEEKEELVAYVRQVVDGCLAFQRPDLLFHDIVDDPSSFVEANLAQMLCYTIYRGVAGGWLGEEYLERAGKMREEVLSHVDDHGLVQGVCAAPTFDHPGTAPEGQAFFLFMEAAFRDLQGRGGI